MPTEELFGAYNFLLEVSGVVAGGFRSVEVASLEVEGQAGPSQPAFRCVARPESLSKLRSPGSAPAASSHGSVTLKRGLTSADLGQQSVSPRHKVPDITLKRGMVSGSGARPGQLTSKTEDEDDAVTLKVPNRLKWQDITLKLPISHSVGGVMKWNNVKNAKWHHDLSFNTGQAQSRSRLDSAAHKLQPSVLGLGGFVASGALIPDRNAHQSGRIVLRGPSGTPVAQWSFAHAWPCKWEGPSRKSESGDTVFLVVEQFTRV